MLIYVLIFAVVSYLLGSIPTAVWVGKKFYNIDVREHGSKNAGTTNVLRVLGNKAALPVFTIDVLKGLCAVLLAYLIPGIERGTETFGLLKIAFGLLAVLGHMYPVFAGFRGGKGVATLSGMAFAIFNPCAALVALGVFAVVFLITRIVSLGSMSAGVALPIAVIFLFGEPTVSLCVFSVVVCALLFYTHRKNIRRLLDGVETKTTFTKKGV